MEIFVLKQNLFPVDLLFWLQITLYLIYIFLYLISHTYIFGFQLWHPLGMIHKYVTNTEQPYLALEVNGREISHTLWNSYYTPTRWRLSQQKNIFFLLKKIVNKFAVTYPRRKEPPWNYYWEKNASRKNYPTNLSPPAPSFR